MSCSSFIGFSNIDLNTYFYRVVLLGKLHIYPHSITINAPNCSIYMNSHKIGVVSCSIDCYRDFYSYDTYTYALFFFDLRTEKKRHSPRPLFCRIEKKVDES